MDIPGPLSPPLPIVHYLRQVFRVTSRIDTELQYVGLADRPTFARPCEGVHRSTFELVPTSPAVSRMSGSSNFDSFPDRW